MTRPSDEPLITEQELTARVVGLAQRLSAEYANSTPLFLIVLKGSVYFGADLARAMSIPVEIEFIRARSYDGRESSGAVEFAALPMEPLSGRDVLIVEDILDSGLTARKLVEWAASRDPASLRLCALLDKPEARKTEIEADYVGFVIADDFVVGYGLDYEQRYRELPAIYRLDHDG